MRKNQLVVGKEKDLYSETLIADNINWISEEKPKPGIICFAKIRSSHKGEKCRIVKLSDRSVGIKFKKPVRAVTPGQSVVFYKDNQLLGGGIII